MMIGSNRERYFSRTYEEQHTDLGGETEGAQTRRLGFGNMIGLYEIASREVIHAANIHELEEILRARFEVRQVKVKAEKEKNEKNQKPNPEFVTRFNKKYAKDNSGNACVEKYIEHKLKEYGIYEGSVGMLKTAIGLNCEPELAWQLLKGVSDEIQNAAPEHGLYKEELESVKTLVREYSYLGEGDEKWWDEHEWNLYRGAGLELHTEYMGKLAAERKGKNKKKS